MSAFHDDMNIGEMVYQDKIGRPHYAFGLWLATLQAARIGIKKLKVFEFGVATGAGLINLCDIMRHDAQVHRDGIRDIWL